ncbi:hypothetical protein GCM10009429_17560 [Dyella marensis]
MLIGHLSRAWSTIGMPDSPLLQSLEISIMTGIQGSYRGLIYIAIYRRKRDAVSWSASLEDDDGEVTFVANRFLCSLGTVDCESAVRQRILTSIDDYHRRHETPILH